MQDLLATYLYQHKNCPLPGIGSLRLNDISTSIVHGQQKIVAAPPSIELTKQDIPCAELINYISSEQNISIEDAKTILKQYCSKLKFMGTHEEIALTEAGKFTVSVEGELVFTPIEIATNYFPGVHAEKVIRLKDTHAILVGDTETTNTVMTEFYSEEGAVSKDRWWIWAIVLSILASILILFYISDANNKSGGDAQKISPKEAAPTYTSPN